MTRRARIGRLRSLVGAAVRAAAAPPAEVWLPAKDGRGDPPGRYPAPGGRAVLVLYAATDPDPRPEAAT